MAGLLQESRRSIKFDLSSRAQYLDPERMERTVYVSPLAANITPDMVKVSIIVIVHSMLPLQPHLGQRENALRSRTDLPVDHL